MKSFFALFLAVVFISSAFASDNSGFYLKDGDRVVFYGDSITDQRLYTTFVETYVVTRFPTMDVTFVHSGWGGDRVSGGGGGAIDTRLKRDVFAYKPTVMTIMLGMNDASYVAFDEKIFAAYKKGYEHIIESVKQNVPSIRLTLIRPSPFDDVTQPPKFEGGYNQVLVRYGDFVSELAQRNGATVADLNAPVVAALQKAKETNREVARQLIADRIHPGAPGQLLMANELLKAWKAPATVSVVRIDAASDKAPNGVGTEISDVKRGETVSWTQTDAGLPMPIGTNEPVTALAVKSSDVVQSLDQQVINVNGLSAASYTLKIDGRSFGAFSKEELAQSINIALLPTPMQKQAAEVHKLTLSHNDIHFARWRQIQVPMEKYPRTEKGVKELSDLLDQEEAEVVKKQRAMAQPKPHKFELVPKRDE
jgi:lysophospholipase L1-like esterase